MAKESKIPFESVNELAAQTIEQARGAMEKTILISFKSACSPRLGLKRT